MNAKIKEFADILSQTSRQRDITNRENYMLKENNLVAIYGDEDTVEVLGNVKSFKTDDIERVDEKVTIYIHKSGYYCDELDERIEIFKDIFEETYEIQAYKGEDTQYDEEEDTPYEWILGTEIPHEKFDIYDYSINEKYSQGIIFSLEDLV
jgi:hypothetical protein